MQVQIWKKSSLAFCSSQQSGVRTINTYWITPTVTTCLLTLSKNSRIKMSGLSFTAMIILSEWNIFCHTLNNTPSFNNDFHQFTRNWFELIGVQFPSVLWILFFLMVLFSNHLVRRIISVISYIFFVRRSTISRWNSLGTPELVTPTTGQSVVISNSGSFSVMESAVKTNAKYPVNFLALFLSMFLNKRSWSTK